MTRTRRLPLAVAGRFTLVTVATRPCCRRVSLRTYNGLPPGDQGPMPPKNNPGGCPAGQQRIAAADPGVARSVTSTSTRTGALTHGDHLSGPAQSGVGLVFRVTRWTRSASGGVGARTIVAQRRRGPQPRGSSRLTWAAMDGGRGAVRRSSCATCPPTPGTRLLRPRAVARRRAPRSGGAHRPSPPGQQGLDIAGAAGVNSVKVRRRTDGHPDAGRDPRSPAA